MGIQWHRVFDDALRSTDVVAVVRTAAHYLGREPTRSEVNAVRRAANSHARGSNSQTLHAWANPNGRAVKVLLLARSDADLEDYERLYAVASGRTAPAVPAGPRRGPKGPQVIENLTAAVVKSGRSAELAELTQLDPQHAKALALELRVALESLKRFEDRLTRHGRVSNH